MVSLNYIQEETATVWTDTGGDKLLDLGSLGPGSLAMGAYLDLGTLSKADWYEAVLKIDGYSSNASVGDIFELWFAQSNDASNFDGQPTTAPGASTQGTITADQRFNCMPCLFIRAYSATLADVIQGRCRIKLTSRYIAPIVVNRSSAGVLQGTGDSHTLTLTPIPQEGQ